MSVQYAKPLHKLKAIARVGVLTNKITIMKLQKLVTKEWLIAKLDKNAEHVIGRALVAIYSRQVDEEKSGITIFANGVGFSKPDANLGTLTAKIFLRSGNVPDKLKRLWLLPNRKNEPRIVKYANQLNEIANQKLLQNGTR
jgi:hypothetical protein